MKKIFFIIATTFVLLAISFSICYASNEIEAIEANSIHRINVKIISTAKPHTVIIVDNDKKYLVDKIILTKHIKKILSLSQEELNASNDLVLDNIFIYNYKYNKHEIFREHNNIYLFLYSLYDEYSGDASYLKLNMDNANKLLKILISN